MSRTEVSRRTRATGSIDEDSPSISRKPKKSTLVTRGLQAAAAVLVVALVAQLLPGGLLGNTAAGLAVQSKLQAVSRALNLVSHSRVVPEQSWTWLCARSDGAACVLRAGSLAGGAEVGGAFGHAAIPGGASRGGGPDRDPVAAADQRHRGPARLQAPRGQPGPGFLGEPSRPGCLCCILLAVALTAERWLCAGWRGHDRPLRSGHHPGRGGRAAPG